MAYRKYDTCFFERYAMLALKTLLGHKFDNLVNEDRPDLQSIDRKTLGIEVTRAMEGGKAGALQLLKSIAGIVTSSQEESDNYRRMIDYGYGYGIQEGVYVGGLELEYWKTAQPMMDIIRSKVGKVSSGFYGDFEEYGLFVFSKDPVLTASAMDTMLYIMDLQKHNDIRYSRLYIYAVDRFYACNLEDDIAFEYRMSEMSVNKETRKNFFLDSLDYTETED